MLRIGREHCSKRRRPLGWILHICAHVRGMESYLVVLLMILHSYLAFLRAFVNPSCCTSPNEITTATQYADSIVPYHSMSNPSGSHRTI